MIIEESRALPVPANTIVEFLKKLDAHYLDWHPDHVSFDWLDGGRREHFYFAERIGGWMLRMGMRVTRSDNGRVAVCRPTSAIARLVFPWMSFEARSEGNGCRYIHRIKPRLGPRSDPCWNAPFSPRSAGIYGTKPSIWPSSRLRPLLRNCHSNDPVSGRLTAEIQDPGQGFAHRRHHATANRCHASPSHA